MECLHLTSLCILKNIIPLTRRWFYWSLWLWSVPLLFESSYCHHLWTVQYSILLFITALIFFYSEVDHPFFAFLFCSLISLQFCNDNVVSLCSVWICNLIFWTALHFCIFLLPHCSASVQIWDPHGLASSVILEVFHFLVYCNYSLWKCSLLLFQNCTVLGAYL